jgi:hypothetical protein
MASYYIHMDQGLVVDLRHDVICSGQFSSCAPIVFYNAATHLGGLYHLGGCSQLDAMQTHHLRTMETVVRPTVIYVLCGYGDVMLGPAHGHVVPVVNMFVGRTVHTDVNGRTDFSSITVSEVAGVLDLRPGYSNDNKLNLRARISALPDTVGFIGETDDNALSMWA